METEILSEFKAEINGVCMEKEVEYDFLKSFIESLEKEYNLEISNKEVTEFIRERLYDRTEKIYNEGNYTYEESKGQARGDLLYDTVFIRNLFNKLPNKIKV